MEKEPEQNPSQTPGEPAEEKLEFLKREEVRTMAKDIATVREKQAKTERERIANLQGEAKLPKKPEIVLSQDPEERPRAVSKNSTEAPPTPGTFQRLRGLPAQAGSSAESTRPSQAVDSDPAEVKQLTSAPKKQEAPKRPLLPRRPLKRSEKLFIRFLIGGIAVFLIFNVVAFGFWYFFKQNTQQSPESQNTQQKVQAPVAPAIPEPQPSIEPPGPEPQPPEPQPEVLLPPAKTPVVFFEAPQQELFLETPEKLLLKLRDFLLTGPALGFTNLVVKTKEDILSSQEFLQATKITMPQELREKLGESLMLFSYVTETKKRLGFIMELKTTEDASEILQAWEQSMERDLASFFDIIGRKGSAYTPFFRPTTYQGMRVRFQTFSVIDFGIVYSIVQGKLLLTSSLESFKKTVDQLKAI